MLRKIERKVVGFIFFSSTEPPSTPMNKGKLCTIVDLLYPHLPLRDYAIAEAVVDSSIDYNWSSALKTRFPAELNTMRTNAATKSIPDDLWARVFAAHGTQKEDESTKAYVARLLFDCAIYGTPCAKLMDDCALDRDKEPYRMIEKIEYPYSYIIAYLCCF
jgi:hypothetical protein